MQRFYNIEDIRYHSEKVLKSRKLQDKDAFTLVDSMLSSDINGVPSHGIRMLLPYIKKIDNNEFSIESIIIKKSFPSFSIIDAQNTIGAISASFAVELAIKQAKKFGIHTVFSYNSNTFGAGMYYVEKIANSGMIGFICSNTPPTMAAYNGLEAMLGTNPLSFSMPTKSHGNVIIDMATSIVAKSKFAIAKAKGEKLKEGWAVDKYGNPTTDPDEGIQGFVLPMAGFKGYGIAMMIDIVSGLLSGAGYLNNVRKFYSQDGSCMNVGHMIIAFNPELIYDGDFLSEADVYIEKLRNSRAIENSNIIIPGDDRKEYRERVLKHGIPLTDNVVVELEKLFEKKLILST